MSHLSLASFGSERRIAAIAIFKGTHLEDIRLRHLAVDVTKATGSVRELVTRFLERHQPECVAISHPSSKAGERALVFCAVVTDIAKELGIPVLNVETSTLLNAYGHPRLTRKEHLRRTGRTIWPSLRDLPSKRAVVDASITGLYVQTERLFSQLEADL